MGLLVVSPFGLGLRGIRGSESRMLALGYNVWLHKYAAFVISGVFAGFGGTLWAYYNGFVSPNDVQLVTSVETRGDELVLKADVERVDRFGREYQIVREPFVKRVLDQDRRSLPLGHYVAIGPDRSVAAAGTVEASDPGDYRVDLRSLRQPGRYAILVALTVDDNRTDLPVKVVPWTR